MESTWYCDLLYQPQMIVDGDCGAIGGGWGGTIGRGNWSTQRKPAPVSLCPPQIPHDLTQARTWSAAVGSQWLTAWAMAWNTMTGETEVGKGEHIYLAWSRSAIKMWDRNVLYVYLKGGHNIWKNSWEQIKSENVFLWPPTILHIIWILSYTIVNSSKSLFLT
jgi:hypothetical protein